MDAADADRTPDDDATDRGEAAAQQRGHEHLELHVSRSRAFDAYARDFGAWWQDGRTPRDELHVEQHAGGAIVQHASGEEQPWGEVLEVEPGHRIRHSYRHGGEGRAVVTAEFRDGEHGGTVVELQHEPWEGDDDERAALQATWTEALRRLEAIASAV